MQTKVIFFQVFSLFMWLHVVILVAVSIKHGYWKIYIDILASWYVAEMPRI